MNCFRLCLLICLLSLLSTFSAAATELHLSVAASLAEALKEVNTAFNKRYPDIKLRANYASSGALARQITAGAPADIYISANPGWMHYLQEQQLVAASAPRVLVHNSLVFVCRQAKKIRSLDDLPPLERIALGSPKSVPAGRYAEQALSNVGLYPGLQAGNRLVLAKDVRQALLYADRGEVDGAFVYRTDALLARQAKICFSVPQRLYPQVSYPAAPTRAADDNPAAAVYFSFLFDREAQQVLAGYGFQLAKEH